MADTFKICPTIEWACTAQKTTFGDGAPGPLLVKFTWINNIEIALAMIDAVGYKSVSEEVAKETWNELKGTHGVSVLLLKIPQEGGLEPLLKIYQEPGGKHLGEIQEGKIPPGAVFAVEAK